MANTRERQIINPPIRFCNDFDHIDSVGTPSPPPGYRDSPHYLDPLAPSPRRSPNRQTYDLHVKGRVAIREVGMVHHADILPTPATRRENPRVFERGYAIAVSAHKMPPSLPHRLQQRLLCTNICRASRKSVSTPPGEWTTLTSSRSESHNYAVSIASIHPIRITKSYRIPVAEALADAIDRTPTSSSNTEWNSLVFIHILALGITISPNTTGSSLSSIIRANLRRLTCSPADRDTPCQQLPRHHARKETSSSENLRSHINSNLKLNNVKATIAVVASDDTVLEVTPEVLQSLRPKHPTEPEDSQESTIPADNIPVSADQNKTMRSLQWLLRRHRRNSIR